MSSYLVYVCQAVRDRAAPSPGANDIHSSA